VPKPFASIEEALEWLDAHIDYERVAPTRRLLPSLGGVERALELLGHPERSYPVIHLTGTNGKGSTTAMVSALLVELGLSVGTYTSPNLHVVNERIAWNLEPIEDDELTDLLHRLSLLEPQLEEPLTRFELLTVAALAYFADTAVDVAVVEVGLGGTWDSTNVVEATVAVLTNVSLDHTQVLGETEHEIAIDKAGIIKPGSSVVLGDVDDQVATVVRQRCEEVGAAVLWQAGEEFQCEHNRLAYGGRVVDLSVPGALAKDVMIPLHGAHQGDNAAVALAAVSVFLGRAPSQEVIKQGFGRVVVPGRLEVLGHMPLIIVDGAHNAAGAVALGEALEEGFEVTGPKVCVLGMLQGRDPIDLLEPLARAGVSTLICVEPETPRALDAAMIEKAGLELGLSCSVAPSIAVGVKRACGLAGRDGLVLATGSLYVVGDARLELLALLKDRARGGEARG
jgi:dihydrofolate synthase/folylpolyglutamate synthase